MADAQGRQNHSYADLPGELVRRTFAGAGDDKYTCTLTVEDRCPARVVLLLAKVVHTLELQHS